MPLLLAITLWAIWIGAVGEAGKFLTRARDTEPDRHAITIT